MKKSSVQNGIVWLATMGILALWFIVPTLGWTMEARKGSVSVNGGIGFTLSPDTFLMEMRSDYFLGHHLSVGPMGQMGISDDIFLFAPSFNVRGLFDLSRSGFGRRIKPSVTAGAGFVYASTDAGASNADDVGFLFNFGFATDVRVSGPFSLGTSILFNIVPNRMFQDRFFFSWEFLSAQYRF